MGIKMGRLPSVLLDHSALALVVLALLVLVVVASVGCGAAATDQNEPNDELNEATVLVPGVQKHGVLDVDDSDLFRCDVPAPEVTDEDASSATSADEASQDEGSHPFVVTVRSDAAEDIELEVGASIPDSWEGISWPGWDAVRKDDRIEVAAQLRQGTVIMVLTGAAGSDYTIEIAWQ